MRLLQCLLLTVSVLGCDGQPKKEDSKDTVPNEYIVRNWVGEIPHVLIWGVDRRSDPAKIKEDIKFDVDAWIIKGKKIKDVEATIRGVIERNDTTVDQPIYVYALGCVGSAESVPVLLKCLDRDDIEVQSKAIEALGKIKDPSAAKALGGRLILLMSSEPGLHATLADALGRIGDDSALRYLEKAAANQRDPELAEAAKVALNEARERVKSRPVQK